MEYLDLLNHLLNDNIGGVQVVRAEPITGVVLAIIALILALTATILSIVLRPHPIPPVAASLSDFQVPTAEEGRPIPIVFGTVLVKGINVVWYGDLRKDEIPAPS